MPKGTRGLWLLLALQLFCASYFGYDALRDALGYPDTNSLRDSDLFEYIFAAALLASLALAAREVWRLTQRHKRMAQQISIASGALHEIIDQHFEDWALTASEREVALLAIKGFSVAEMAEMRQTKEGTIKAQSAAVYRKAGVTGRLQLLSLFIEELMAERLIQGGTTA